MAKAPSFVLCLLLTMPHRVLSEANHRSAHDEKRQNDHNQALPKGAARRGSP